MFDTRRVRQFSAGIAVWLGVVAVLGSGAVVQAQSSPFPQGLDASSVGIAPPHLSAPQGGARFIVFGDSQTAGTNFPFIPDDRQCYQSPTRWPLQVAQGLGVAGTSDYQDYSCWGGNIDTPPGWQLADQARSASKNGAFGPRTENIVVQVGMNDFWGTPGVDAATAGRLCWINLIQGCDLNAVAEGRSQDPATITPKTYADRTRAVVTYLKYYAPHARISFVGYPDMVGPDKNACLAIFGLPLVQPRSEAYRSFFDRLDAAQRGAAADMRINFIDLRAATAGHGPCTLAPWVPGVLDPRSESLGVPMHQSKTGEAVVAGAVLAAIKR